MERITTERSAPPPFLGGVSQRRRVGAMRKKHPLRRSPLLTVVVYVGAAIVCVVVLFPFYWIAVSAFREPSVLLRSNSLLPGPFSLANFRELIAVTPFRTYFVNSVYVAVGVTVLNVVIATPAGYFLSRATGRVPKVAARSVLVGYMLPGVFVIIPIFIVLANVGLANTRIGVIIGLLAEGVPLGIWLMIGYLRTLPYEVEEAALVDGASWLTVFVRIVLPMARPGVITVGVFSFILGWVDYLVALTVISEDNRTTLSVGIATLFGGDESRWGMIVAGSLVISLPIFLFVAVAGRYLTGGLTLGATK